MARRIVSITTITPTATADTTNLVDATYPFLLQGRLRYECGNTFRSYC